MYQKISEFTQSQREFWFSNTGPANLAEILIIAALFGLIFITGVALLSYNRWKIGSYPPKNKIFKFLGSGPVYTGLFGFIFLFFRWLGIDFLGARFFPLIIVVISAVWVLFFAYLYRKKVPDEVIRYETKLVKKKYLSKK
jgi:fatty acid desaturase